MYPDVKRRVINGEKRWVAITKGPDGKERVRLLHPKTERLIVNLPGDALLTPDQYNKFMKYYEYFHHDGWEDPECQAFHLLKRDDPSLKDFKGFQGVNTAKSKFNYAVRFQETVLKYTKGKDEAKRHIDYLTDSGWDNDYQGGKFLIEKVQK